MVVKLHSGLRAKKLAENIPAQEWKADSCHAGRMYALIKEPHPYQTLSSQGSLIQLAVRCLKTSKVKALSSGSKKVKAGKTAVVAKVGQANQVAQAQAGNTKSESEYAYSVLVIQRGELAALLGSQLDEVAKQQIILGQLHFYDQRAGIEAASFKGDKQGLAIEKRRKHSLSGQEMLIGLARLARNLLGWMRSILAKDCPKVRQFGMKRLVRDWLAIKGLVTFTLAAKLV